MTLGRFIRTAAHLRTSQLAWKFRSAVRLQADRFRAPDYRWPAGDARFVVAAPHVRALEIGRLRSIGELLRQGYVEYLAVRQDSAEWLGREQSRSWRYERQYHSELVALAVLSAVDRDESRVADAQRFISTWMAACPQPHGEAWEPYPVARRILNWVLAAYIAPSLGPTLAAGIAAQVRFLGTRIEHHVLGNHLICDAAALFSGCNTVEAPGLDEIRRDAASLLVDELERQVLSDGGFAERTAQYHAWVLRDTLLAVAFGRLRGVALDTRVERVAQSMSTWLAEIARKDSVPFLNDAAPDAAPSVSEVLSLARALRLIDGPWDTWLGRAFGLDSAPGDYSLPGELNLPETGWSIIREGSHQLLFEHGPIGPDEQPGHGHSDALSYELFWDGHPMVTDTGVTTYETGPIRDFERSAPAHATVSVGGEGPDELWAAFRVGARARVQGGPLMSAGYGVRKFEGLVRAPAGWAHRRRLLFWPGEALVVFDFVRGARDPVRSHLPLAPGCTLAPDGVLRSPAGELRIEVLRGTRDDGVRSWVGEGFGRRRERMTFSFVADAEGRVAYAILAPGRSVVLHGATCLMRGPRGSVDIPGVA